MAGGREASRIVTLAELERRPVDPNAMPHRRLLTPGPIPPKLKIRPSQYQRLVCRPSKRKADSPTIDSSSGSTPETVQPSTKPEKVKPAKALKVIHHRFSNGEDTKEGSSGSQASDANEENVALGNSVQTGDDNDGTGAAPGHLMYQTTRTGKWKSTNRQPRKYDFGLDDAELLSDRGSRRQTNPNYYPDPQTPEATPDDQIAAPEVQVTSDERRPSHHLCSGSACGRPGCGLYFKLENFTSGSLSNDNQFNESGADTFFRRFSLPHELPESSAASDNQPQSAIHHRASDLTTTGPQSYHIPPMSMREMAVNLYPEMHQHSQTQDDDDQAAYASATATLSPPVSPIAHGAVWESRATRRMRRRQELEIARSNPSTPIISTPENTTELYLTTYPSLPLNGTSSTPTESREGFSTTSNTFSVPATSTLPPRFQNQDTDCLVCVQPVTTSDLLVMDLRCVACPRIFHSHCLTYIPPSKNQNWRCSLCYREAWYGYGDLPAERDVENPSLVERYRRRLLLAKTYGDFVDGLEGVRFWFDVDMDGGLESDQAVLVGMGLANEWKLRLVGQGGKLKRVKTVEEMERWGIAMGMALQDEESKAEELKAEVEMLKGMIQDKRAEIQEPESGL